MDIVPGTASLLDELDSRFSFSPPQEKLFILKLIITNCCDDFIEKLMVLLRDGRTLIGYLRSVDQFANLVLHPTIERIHVGKQYGDIPRGVFIVRGENVVLLGEIVSCYLIPNNKLQIIIIIM